LAIGPLRQASLICAGAAVGAGRGGQISPSQPSETHGAKKYRSTPILFVSSFPFSTFDFVFFLLLFFFGCSQPLTLLPSFSSLHPDYTGFFFNFIPFRRCIATFICLCSANRQRLYFAANNLFIAFLFFATLSSVASFEFGFLSATYGTAIRIISGSSKRFTEFGPLKQSRHSFELRNLVCWTVDSQTLLRPKKLDHNVP
jgi:hypothetical protein